MEKVRRAIKIGEITESANIQTKQTSLRKNEEYYVKVAGYFPPHVI